MPNLKYLSNTKEELNLLKEGVDYLLSKFIIFSKKDTLWIDSARLSVKTLDDKFYYFSKEVKGIIIKPDRKDLIERVVEKDFPNENLNNYPIFYFNSSKEGLKIGLSSNEEKKYLFDIRYQFED